MTDYRSFRKTYRQPALIGGRAHTRITLSPMTHHLALKHVAEHGTSLSVLSERLILRDHGLPDDHLAGKGRIARRPYARPAPDPDEQERVSTRVLLSPAVHRMAFDRAQSLLLVLSHYIEGLILRHLGMPNDVDERADELGLPRMAQPLAKRREPAGEVSQT